MVTTQKGSLPAAYQTSGDEDKTEYSEDGFKIFKDTVEIPVMRAELLFIWQVCADLLEGAANLHGKSPVPPHEAEKMFELMEMLSNQDKDTRKEFKLKLPINYCVGLWHGVNSARKFHIYKEDTDKDRYLTDVTLKVATIIDHFHKRKDNQGFAEHVRPSISSTSSLFEIADKSNINKSDKIASEEK